MSKLSIYWFQDTQVQRLLEASSQILAQTQLTCPACPSRQESSCSLMRYACGKIREAKEEGHRLYLYGASGSGKTKMTQSHFHEYRTFLPYSNETFGFDGYDKRLHSCIFFDEFQVITLS